MRAVSHQPISSEDTNQLVPAALRLIRLKRNALIKERRRIERALARLGIAECELRTLFEVNPTPSAEREPNRETDSELIRFRSDSRTTAFRKINSIGTGGHDGNLKQSGTLTAPQRDDLAQPSDTRGAKRRDQNSNANHRQSANARQMSQISMVLSVLARDYGPLTRAQIIDAVRRDYGRPIKPRSLSVQLNKAAKKGFVRRHGRVWNSLENSNDKHGDANA